MVFNVIRSIGEDTVLSRAMFGSKVLVYYSMLFLVGLIKLLPAQEIARLPKIEPNSVTTFKQTEKEDLLTAIEDWLSIQFEMPQIDRHPRIELVSSSTMASLRYGKYFSSLNGEGVVADGQTTSQQETVSLYDDATQTIYLPESWSGTTDVEISILVHEMVHHFQNLLGLKYACAQEREKLAYMAQDRWLVQSGRSLASDFDLDPFSLLVTTTCKY
jgi:hypothetical protein